MNVVLNYNGRIKSNHVINVFGRMAKTIEKTDGRVDVFVLMLV